MLAVVHEAMEVAAQHKPQHLPTNRANAATPEVIGAAWFDKFESVLGRIGLADMPPEELPTLYLEL